MALNLACKVGERVRVGDRDLVLVEFDIGKLRGVVQTDDGFPHELTNDRSVEVFPEVFVSIGLKSQHGTASLSFEAPRSIMILRESLVENDGDVQVRAG